jgi:hypothetical protein
MTWQEKAIALSNLGPLVVRMRGVDDWYALCEHVEVADDVLVCHTFGNGATPTEAIEAYWERLSTLADGGGKKWKWVRVDDTRCVRYYRWGGFMWEMVSERAAVKGRR